MQRLHTPQEAARWLRQRVSGQLRTDSRHVRAGDAFLAWPGAQHDGRRFVPDVLARGAAACLVEEGAWAGAEAFGQAAHEQQVACYAQLKAACGPIAAAYHEQPSHALDVLAVTDFPEPDSPTSASRSPARMVRSISWTTSVSPNDTDSPFNTSKA
mgnify:CR=1 FL=1